jgi:hypothetical protein
LRRRIARAAGRHPTALRDEVIAAKERVMRALIVVGPEVSGILVDICCELKGLEEAEKANGWPARAGKVVLQIALTRLAKHYGLDRRGRRRATQTRRPASLGQRGLPSDDRRLAQGSNRGRPLMPPTSPLRGGPTTRSGVAHPTRLVALALLAALPIKGRDDVRISAGCAG